MSAAERRALATQIAEYANSIDPGPVDVFSINARTAAKQRHIADHYTAYGIRTALLALGYDLPAVTS